MNILFALIITIAIVTGVTTGMGGSNEEGEQGFDLASLFSWLLESIRGAETEVSKLADEAIASAEKPQQEPTPEPVQPEPEPIVAATPAPAAIVTPAPALAVAAPVEAVAPPAPEPVVAEPKVYRLRWQVPQQRENGDPLSVADIAAYEILFTSEDGSVNEKLVVPGDNTSYDIAGLEAGVYHFAIVAVDQEGLQSRLSETLEVAVD